MGVKDKYYYDQKSADRVINFIERICKHSKGPLAGKNFILAKWQRELINELFGWKETKTNYRKYRTCYLEIPRKNGKSTLASALALYLTFADGEKGAEVYTVAGDKEQAKIIFNQCRQMCLDSEVLKTNSEIFKDSITYKASVLKAISADSDTAHGTNSSAVLFDELHVQKSRDLVDILTTSTGARTQPLVILITTAGWNKNSVCYEFHKHAKKVLTYSL